MVTATIVALFVAYWIAMPPFTPDSIRDHDNDRGG
jgi:hypothetical protein